MSCESKLQNLITDNFVLAYKVQNYHFNVSGVYFHQFHTFFGEIYKALYEWHDTLGESLRQLGKPVKPGVEFLCSNTSIEDANDVTTGAITMVRDIIRHMEVVLSYAQSLSEEAATRNLIGLENTLASYITTIEKYLWMLRNSHEKL